MATNAMPVTLPRASSLTPHIAGSTAASAMTVLTRSIRRLGAEAGRGGSRIGPRRRRTTITGTPSRKTPPHQVASRTTPPTTGPTNVPPTKQANQTPMARPNWASSGKRTRISANVVGPSVAPATPRAALTMISAWGDGAKAATTDTAPKAAAPMSISRRWPIRSPREPMGTRKPASTNE